MQLKAHNNHQYTNRPSKCPKFYTNRNLQEQNLRQKLRKFGQNLNCNKITYLIKYTLIVQFSIKDFTKLLQNDNLLHIEKKK